MPPLASDGSKLAEMLVLHSRGLSQRDVAEHLGVSQRAVCYALGRLRLNPNGYGTRASVRKRSRAAREVWRLRRFRESAATIAPEPWWEATWPLEDGDVSPRLGYHLFAALARLGAVAHGEASVQLLPMGGSVLARAPSDRLRGLVSSLPAGTALRVGGERIRLGVPALRQSRPASSLGSWCVTVKGAHRDYAESGPLGDRLRDEIARMGFGRRAILGLGDRRTIKVNGRLIVGYAVYLSGLKARESLVVQAAGLGGRRRFGCGVFLPC